MRCRVRWLKSHAAAGIAILISLYATTIAWGQGAGPFDTFTVPPCRVLDTRIANPAGPIPANATRSILVAGDLTSGGTVNQGGAANCGVPDTATGVFINVVGVTRSEERRVGNEWIYTWLPVHCKLNFSTGQTIANGL